MINPNNGEQINDSGLGRSETTKTQVIESKDRFFPSGAIAFFVVLVILCLVIWFGIYFLMIDRT